MKEIKRSEFDRKLQAAKDDIAKLNGMQSVAVDWLLSVCELLQHNQVKVIENIATVPAAIQIVNRVVDDRPVVRLGNIALMAVTK